MPDETPTTTTTPTTTASPQGTQTAAITPTQTGNLIESILSKTHPGGNALPFTQKQAAELEKKQAEAAAQTQAAATTQTATTPPDEDTPPAEIKSDAGKASWKQWKAAERAKYVELETKWKAANQELETFKKNPPKSVEIKAPDDYEDIKKREAEYSERLKLLDLQNHPQFKQHFDSKYDTIFNDAKLIAGKDSDKLIQILKSPESDVRTKQLEEIYSGLPEFSKGELSALIRDLRKVNAERDLELSKGKENYTKFVAMQQENQRKQQEQAQQRAQIEFEKQLQAAKQELPIFQKRDGDEAWNKQVDSFEKTARDIYTGNLPLPELARASQWAAAAPLFLQDANAKAQEIANLTAELTRLRAVQPKPGGGTDPKEPQMPANMSLAERVVWQAKQAGAVK